MQKQDKGAVMTMVYKEAWPARLPRCIDEFIKTSLAVDSSTGRVLAHQKTGCVREVNVK
jgi:hypothetical protein